MHQDSSSMNLIWKGGKVSTLKHNHHLSPWFEWRSWKMMDLSLLSSKKILWYINASLAKATSMHQAQFKSYIYDCPKIITSTLCCYISCSESLIGQLASPYYSITCDIVLWVWVLDAVNYSQIDHNQRLISTCWTNICIE